ncbi:hypothetical protein LCGC14_3146840, partial [marine sediment metagenome]
ARVVDRRPSTFEDTELFPPLEAPQERRQVPITIHQLSTQALLKSLTTPKPPETTFTPIEYDEFLSGIGWSQEDIDAEVAITTNELVAAAINRKSMIDSYKSGVAKMPDFTLADVLKMSIINPPLAVLEGLGFYYERVSMPASGWQYGGEWRIDVSILGKEGTIVPTEIGGIPITALGIPILGVQAIPRGQETGIPDIKKAVDEFRNLNPEASAREAYVYAWKKWDAPGPPVIDFVLKYLLLEGLLDPLSFVGWGFVTRGLRSAGPVGRILARGNMAAAEVLELPFDGLKYVTTKVIPKTVTQRATVMSRESQKIVTRAMELAGDGKHPLPLRQMTP